MAYGPAANPPRLNLLRLEETLSQAHLRLARCYIEHLDWQKYIEKYDGPAHGYKQTGNKAVITRAQGRKILELDHRPALVVYVEWTKEPRANVSGGAILTYSVFHPLLMYKNGITLAVHPVNANDDGSIDTGVAIVEGSAIELGAGTLDELINAVEPVIRHAAKNVKTPNAVILSHCGGRAIGLGERISDVDGQVKKAEGDVPWIGYLAFGEQGTPVAGENVHANLSLSALVLGPREQRAQLVGLPVHFSCRVGSPHNREANSEYASCVALAQGSRAGTPSG